MKKLIIALLLFVLVLKTFSQWTYEKEEYGKVAYSERNDGTRIFLYQNKKSLCKPELHFVNNNFVAGKATVIIEFIVKNKKKSYEVEAYSVYGETYECENYIWSKEFIYDFKNATKCYISIKLSIKQTSDIMFYSFEFNMKRSAEAYDYITSKK